MRFATLLVFLMEGAAAAFSAPLCQRRRRVAGSPMSPSSSPSLPLTSLHRSSLLGKPDSSTDEQRQPSLGHTVEVTYEGKTVDVVARPNESILAALERTGAADALSISRFPQDCLRGNCLTCTGKLVGEGSSTPAASSSSSSLRRGDDGLAPQLSEEVRALGYVLTCSSYVVGDGLKVELGRNAEAWDDIYKSRYESVEAERIGQEARAKLLRLTAESNVPKWTKETEQVLKKSG